jgi:hypothetical protein
MTLIELVYIVDARAIERAKRLEAAISMLHDGRTRREVSGQLQRRFQITQTSAWRIADMANDLAGKITP